MVDHYFFSVDTRMVPALVTTVFGLIMYLLGWWLIVGTVGEKPAVRTAIVWYLGAGLAAIILVTTLLAVGINLLNTVD